MNSYLNANIARSKKKAGRITGKHVTNDGAATEEVRTIRYAMKPKARRVSNSLFLNFFLAIMLIFFTDVSFAEQSTIIEAAPGQPVRTILTLGGDSSEITIQVPATITDWVLNPTEPLCTRESTIVIDYLGPWRVMVSSDGPSRGYMAEYDTSSSAYVSGGMRLKNPMIVMAKGGNRVDISNGGVLLDGEGKAIVPITFIQEASLEDEPLPAGHIYRINIIFTGLER